MPGAQARGPALKKGDGANWRSRPWSWPMTGSMSPTPFPARLFGATAPHANLVAGLMLPTSSAARPQCRPPHPGPPLIGHAFFVSVQHISAPPERRSRHRARHACPQLSATTIPIADGGIVYTIAVGDRRGTASLIVLAERNTSSSGTSGPARQRVAAVAALYPGNRRYRP